MVQKMIIVILGCIMIISVCYILQPNKPKLAGTHAAYSIPVAEDNIQLLIDSTTFDPQSGKRIIQQENFDQVLALIKAARKWIYVDFFLWNMWQGNIPEKHRRLSEELSEALINKKRDCPEINILVLTDPINRIYGDLEPEFFHRMARAGIGIVFTDTSKMNDSNTIYSPLINVFAACVGKITWISKLLNKPFLPNIMDLDGRRMSLRQMGRLFFFKANHRKVIIADTPSGNWQMIVTSLNPADGSSAHSNCGLLVSGDIALAALDTELSCAQWSAINPHNCIGDAKQLIRLVEAGFKPTLGHEGTETGTTVEWLTEGAILSRILDMLKDTGSGDDIRIAIFYLSERRVIGAIKAAAKRGATIRIILDANRDAFGHTKIGIPNRPVAAELLKASPNIAIRWADTHGEQFHHKAICIINKDKKKYQFMCGSANWTRRNLADLNLEANLFVNNAPKTSSSFIEYFDRAWNNSDGLSHTVDYHQIGEKGWTLLWKTIVYRMQEASGACTF